MPNTRASEISRREDGQAEAGLGLQLHHLLESLSLATNSSKSKVATKAAPAASKSVAPSAAVTIAALSVIAFFVIAKSIAATAHKVLLARVASARSTVASIVADLFRDLLSYLEKEMTNKVMLLSPLASLETLLSHSIPSWANLKTQYNRFPSFLPLCAPGHMGLTSLGFCTGTW